MYQEPQDWSSSDDELQNEPSFNQNRRFRPQLDERRREPVEYKMKIDLPSYDGKCNIEIFLDWLKNTEIFFYYMNTPAVKKVHLVALK